MAQLTSRRNVTSVRAQHNTTLGGLRKILRMKNWKPMNVHALLTDTALDDALCRQLAASRRRCPQGETAAATPDGARRRRAETDA